MRLRNLLMTLAIFVTGGRALAGDGNRLTYLDELNPYYPSRTFPKLTTPQWVGDPDVEAVVILAIDDMRQPEQYEKFLRPILRRLQKIDGRAPVSIMTCQVDPKHPLLQQWLKEGLSLEVHTIDHPCPFFAGGDFAKSKSTYDRCVDLMNSIPGNKPVAFRMPCCDSLNTQSPRFFSEIFNKTTAKGNFLQIDSSVFNILTSNDPDLPRELVIDPDGQDKFRKYLPYDRSFVNTIEDYPYPYVIGNLCWEFPCVVPSDWEAFHCHGACNPVTVRDLEAALDATVIKQGVFDLVFHPHGWIKSEQIVELIDHAMTKHGMKVKFLTFREAQDRLGENVIGLRPHRRVGEKTKLSELLESQDPFAESRIWRQGLRDSSGLNNGVRLMDINNDGFMDLVVGNENLKQTRIWSPKIKGWRLGKFPHSIVSGNKDRPGPVDVRFGLLRSDGYPMVLLRDRKGVAGIWQCEADASWRYADGLVDGLDLDQERAATKPLETDGGWRFRDLSGDGRCELIISNESVRTILQWSPDKREWRRLSFKLPPAARLVNNVKPFDYRFPVAGQDNGVRFVDIDGDGHDDIVVSNDKYFGIYLFSSMETGWSREIISGKRGGKAELPLIAHDGQNNGAWFHSGYLWAHNEYTNLLKDHVDRRSFNEMLGDEEPRAKSPEASLHSWQVRPGFEVELVALEPLIEDPVAFAWGPDGKLWVVEMTDYPLGVDGKGKPGGIIKILEDTNGDGKYTKATVFLKDLPFPTGIMPWGKGVLITCAPDILYAEDTDGDGKADVVKKLYTGFNPGNQQHRLNGLVWGLDNWIYGANGDSGGQVKSLNTGVEVNISGRDWRIRPDEGLIETQTGNAQFGRCQDDWGNWFGCNNSDPMYHYVLADHYLRRNPHVAPPNPRVQVSVTPGASRVYPISRTLPRFNDPEAANHFTSACSVIVYRDDLFGPLFAGNSFISEPVHNLVHREIMQPNGVTFTSHRAIDERQSEFIASTDNWTRPTTIKTGPDGALWIADMYREVIEHPEWIPKDWQKRLDLRAGHDKGRIYRVFPVGKRPRKIPRLDQLATAGLVAALDSPSGWQRDMAQQMLVERHDAAAVPFLEKQVRESKRPLCRLHSLCTLDGLGSLKPEIIQIALSDAHPGVRRHAIRVSEPVLKKSAELGVALTKLVSDPDPQVRLQLAFTLGERDDPPSGEALGRLALHDAGDRFITAAVLSSVSKSNLDGVLLAVLSQGTTEAAAPLIGKLLALANAFDNTKTVANLLNRVATPDHDRIAAWQFAALAGFLDALDQRNTSLGKLESEGDQVKEAVQRLGKVFGAARVKASDTRAAEEERAQAIRLLGRGLDAQKTDLALLQEFLIPQSPSKLQAAAVDTLGHISSPSVAAVLVSCWKGYSPALRSHVLEILFRTNDGVGQALGFVESGKILPFEIDAARRDRLLKHRNLQIRDRAHRLLAGGMSPDRQKVVDAYRSVLTMNGDTQRGSRVFAKTCATCHLLAGIGHQVGPDLASIGDKSPEALLISVLDPNRSVEARYINYMAVTKNGQTFTGVLANETGNSITLVGPEGKQQVLLRSDLDELTSFNKSVMPEGLEKDLKPQDLADLIAFIRMGKK
jgi:putative membrane-bound dehydrogenase-like protein